MKLNRLSQAPVFVQDAHAQIETRIGGVDACIQATNAQADQFIANPLAGLGVDPDIKERGDAERGGKDHGGGVVGREPRKTPQW